jgi:hypothetical protein
VAALLTCRRHRSSLSASGSVLLGLAFVLLGARRDRAVNRHLALGRFEPLDGQVVWYEMPLLGDALAGVSVLPRGKELVNAWSRSRLNPTVLNGTPLNSQIGPHQRRCRSLCRQASA